MAIFALTFRSG